MRHALIALALLAAPALAADEEPLTCQALDASATAWEEAKQAAEEARYTAFSSEYTVELAIADAEERDAMLAARDAAKADYPSLRKQARAAKKAHKALAREAADTGLVCTS